MWKLEKIGVSILGLESLENIIFDRDLERSDLERIGVSTPGPWLLLHML
jgi:hypothetical protein